jgi:hypothetical protein
MSQISPKLRRGAGIYVFYCPGCKEAHSYRVDMPDHLVKDRPCWTFNGNVDSPSFTPSLRLFVRLEGGGEKTLCHLFVTDGKIIYCGDCDHELNGQTVDLPDLPDFMQGDKYGDGA